MKQKKSRKNRGLNIVLNIGIVLCLAVLGYAGYHLYSIQREYKVSEDEYIAIQEELDEVLPREVLEKDIKQFASDEAVQEALTRLSASNPDFVGLIYIPGTNIYYPMVQGNDNDYYLTHTFEGTYNTSGAIFLDSGASRDLSDTNTIIYGHNMHNKTMFENLNFMLRSGGIQQYNTVYIVTQKEILVYEVFAAKQVTVEDILYHTWFENDIAIDNYLTAIAPGKGFTTTDRVITLSTCTYEVESDNRVVAQAVYRESVPMQGVMVSQLEEGTV